MNKAYSLVGIPREDKRKRYETTPKSVRAELKVIDVIEKKRLEALRLESQRNYPPITVNRYWMDYVDDRTEIITH